MIFNKNKVLHTIIRLSSKRHHHKLKRLLVDVTFAQYLIAHLIPMVKLIETDHFETSLRLLIEAMPSIKTLQLVLLIVLNSNDCKKVFKKNEVTYV